MAANMLYDLLLLMLIQSGVSKTILDVNVTEIVEESQTPYNATDTSVIAFSAELTENIARAGGSPIEFDGEITNSGGLYFPNSGQFLCPDEGVYVFIWSLRKGYVEELPGMRCISKLQMAGEDVKFGPKTNYWSTATSGAAEMMAVIQCTVPAAVTVVVVPWSEIPSIGSEFQPPETSFSGFKLQYPVGFTVELSQNQLLFPGGRIRFDTILSNYGGHFDAVNHRFQCPDNGVYVFSVATHSANPSAPWSVSRLMMEFDAVLHGPITYVATESHDSGSASTTTVLQCVQGSSVYVEAQSSHDFPYNSYGANLTSFSGYKLYDVADKALAFSVVMTSNVTLRNETDERFFFDEVITNIGNAFDASQSEFVCPDDEYYLFTWGTAAIYGSCWMTLLKDDREIKSMYVTHQDSANTTSGTSGSSSMSVIHKCTPGSMYHIEGEGNDDSTVYLGGYTVFSGFRVPGE